jgi:3-hydroxyacyl-[acyl-carrier-protein] dehydratase
MGLSPGPHGGQTGGMNGDGMAGGGGSVRQGFPFRLIDRVLASEGDRVTALRNITVNDPLVQDIGLGGPTLPGLLILEAMAQAAGAQGGAPGLLGGFSLRLHGQARPGDRLVLRLHRLRARAGAARYAATAEVEGRIIAEAEFTLIDG